MRTTLEINDELFRHAKRQAAVVEHGVTESWTADRDFRRFPELRAVDPFA